MATTVGTSTGASRLAGACEAALARLEAKEGAGIDPDAFAEIGEVLFWLCALAEANRRDTQPLILGLKWARNRVAHGVVTIAPVEWHYGSEPGRLVLGKAVLGTTSGHEWLARKHIALGPNDRPSPRQQAAYDAHVAGKRVLDVLRNGLALAR